MQGPPSSDATSSSTSSHSVTHPTALPPTSRPVSGTNTQIPQQPPSQAVSLTAPAPGHIPFNSTQSPYSYTGEWTAQPWSTNAYPYGGIYAQQQQQPQPYIASPSFQYPQYLPGAQHCPPPTTPSAPRQSQAKPSPRPPPKTRPRTPSPSPPPRDLPHHWDAALSAFFTQLGLSQTLKGFEADMLTINPEWEGKAVPSALEALSQNISRLFASSAADGAPTRPLEERKLDYMHVEKDAEVRSPGEINKSISLLLARSRARNDASNRAEFLHQAKRRRLASGDSPDESSCARADAKTIDRDVMMKFDVAKNEEGPLRRTMKSGTRGGKLEQTPSRSGEDDGWTKERHPAFDERMSNLETHLAVRHVPSPPVSLAVRLKFLEDHIINLEREYPPWAALHFNQPRRGWPPPPRPTPIIVASHLTSSAPKDPGDSNQKMEDGPSAIPVDGKGKARSSKSSLHRAVLERLEVQRAMNDLKGKGTS
ncbi:hypothetical protein OF83DRAFT_1178151 [Amylostereum chailletii]|nr:hypothetical protein OF83DRAFT_1178151 [Amylostereum chailletii]